MGKWIDADEMLEYLDLMYEHQDDKDEPYNIGILGAVNYIKHKASSIDIVFCKECKHWNKSATPALQSPNAHPCLRAFSIMLSRADDYCSRGEREGE